MPSQLTPLAVAGVCSSQSFTGRRAREELRYKPLYTQEEAVRRSLEYFRGWKDGGLSI